MLVEISLGGDRRGLTWPPETPVMLVGRAAAGVVLSAAAARKERAEMMKARVKSIVADGGRIGYVGVGWIFE